MALTPKQEAFCLEFMRDLNATQAAIRAGYSPDSAKQIACETLTSHDVQARIAELQAERSKRVKIEVDDVLIELWRMLTADVSDAFDEHGALKPISKIPLDLRRTIAGFDNEEIFAGKGDHRERVGTLRKVRFWSKEKAAELLGRHLAMFTDKLKVEDSDLVKRLLDGRRRASS